jgi:hypothetical protein
MEVLFLVFLILVGYIGFLITKYETMRAELVRTKTRLDAVLIENENLFLDQLENHGIVIKEEELH